MTDWAGRLLRPVHALGVVPRLPLLASLLLIVLLAHNLAQLTWRVWPAADAPGGAPAAPSTPGTAPADPQHTGLWLRIADWHLFGVAPQQASPPPVAAPRRVAAPVPKPVVEPAAPVLLLNLRLYGVIASGDSTLARAIISAGGAAEDSYALGDALPGGAVLREIHSDRVVLEYQGRRETLRLAEQAAAPAAAPPRVALLSSSGPPTVEAAGALDNAALLREYRQALISNPQSLVDVIRAVPVNDAQSGALKGYQISPARDRRLLSRFGLRSGDVVTAVNGVALDNPVKALEVMQTLATASKLNLTVERNGETQSFIYDVD
jgi:general secretion pathway protein C